MFCPGCRSEYRPGYTRCVPCDRELVDSLDAVEEEPLPEARDIPRVPMTDYCGFLDLGEVRGDRDRLHAAGIVCEIAIRPTPETVAAEVPVEEYWLRVDRQRLREVSALLGDGSGGESEKTESGQLTCSNCKRPVREEESFCANCGTRFA